MVNKITTAYASEIESISRLEPKYFLFQTILNNTKKRFKFIKLGDISDNIIRGQSPKPDTYRDKYEEGYVFIRTADVKKYQINFQTTVYLNKETFESQKRNRIKGEDILISVVGNYLGSTSIIPKNIYIGAFNDNSARIRIKDNLVSPYYVSFFLNSHFGQELINSVLTRTAQKILSAGNVKKLEIPIIEDKTIEENAKKIYDKEIQSLNLLENAKKLLYQKLGIDFSKVKKRNFFSVNLSDFSETDLWTPAYSYPFYINILKIIQNKFPTIPIGEIAIVKKGDEVGSINYNKYLDKKNSDIPFIRTSDLVNYEVDQFPDYYIPDEIYQELKQDIKAGDILFTNDGKIGLAAMLTSQDKIILQSHVKRLRLKKEAIEKYNFTQEFLFLILTLKEIAIYQAERYTVIQSTIPTISNYILDFEIPILDKDSIEEITKLVKQAFKLKEEKKILLNEVRELIDNYFEI
ncbi:MAG TPA: hypothetical protein PKO31_02285 [Methanofastidiosum sp.]|nr:hypothetical protein [Methanofastidiosum sp.]HQK62879.1 hypothetical protein [Methanofastidiosum sp.]